MDNHNASAGKKILFVDDELQILRSLERLFFDSEYEILTADSGQHALSVLESTHIDLIITDMRMPVMDGYQLLCEVKQKYPDILRVILSGYSDERSILNALQKNLAKLYIFKPWDNNKLLKLVGQIFETERLLKDSNLLSMINNIEGLPMLKSNYQQILNLIDNEGDISQISAALERDLAIATKVLHVANSAFFGVNTGSVKQAVTYLGLTNIRNLLISTSIVESLNVKGIYGQEIDYLWEHAFLCNKLVNAIFEKAFGRRLSENEQSAGLLHNVGHVFLLKFFSEQYMGMNKSTDISSYSILDVEQEEFNVTHQQTGGYLMKWWDLPYPIVEAALFHHNPFDERIINKELVYVVNIAQYYASKMLKKNSEAFLDYRVFELVGLTQSKVETIVEGIRK